MGRGGRAEGEGRRGGEAEGRRGGGWRGRSGSCLDELGREREAEAGSRAGDLHEHGCPGLGRAAGASEGLRSRGTARESRREPHRVDFPVAAPPFGPSAPPPLSPLSHPANRRLTTPLSNRPKPPQARGGGGRGRGEGGASGGSGPPLLIRKVS